jgi:2'-5' RNA ligase
MPRVFFALPLPDDLRDAVSEAVRPARAHPADVAWTRRSNLHVTLRFLGDVPDERIPELVAAAGPWVRRLAPGPILLAGGGAFPHAHRPRVLWVGVDGGDRLPGLAKAIDASVVSLGFAADNLPWVGHLTVGRVRGGRATKTAAALLEVGEIGQFTPEHVVLYESVQTPEGVKYRALEMIAF